VVIGADDFSVFGHIVSGTSEQEVADSLLQAAIRLTNSAGAAVQCRSSDGFTGAWTTEGVTPKTAEQLNRLLDGYGAKPGVQRFEADHPILRSLPGGWRPSTMMRAVGRNASDGQLTVILFGRPDGPSFSAVDATVLDTLVTVAKVAVSGIAQRDTHRRWEQWMAAIDATADLMLGVLSARSVLDKVLDAVARRALDISHADMCAVATPSDTGNTMILRVAVGRHRQTLTGLVFPEGHSLSGTVSRTARQLLVDDAATDRRATEVAARVALGPAAIAPLMLRGQPVGVVFVGNTRGERPLDHDLAVDAVTVRDLDACVLAASGSSTVEPDLAQLATRVQGEAKAWRELPKLTERDFELLGHLAEGLTNGEIGARMFLAEKTVRNLVSQLLARLGVHNRVEAAVLMTRYSERQLRPSAGPAHADMAVR
jgi:DNA-binding CsgD family transcriptional regulator